MKYFKHDSDAHRSARLSKLRIRYGMEGYGLYWYILEVITNDICEHNLTFEIEYDSELIAHYTGINREQVECMMRYMVDLGLFENTNGHITCMKLAHRLDQSMTGSNQFRQLINKIKDVHDIDSSKSHDKVMIDHDNVMLDKTRLDKTRQEKTIQKTRKKPRVKKFQPPTYQDCYEYLIEKEIPKREIDDHVKRFLSHYETVGWKVGRANKVMKSWKAALSGWILRAPDFKINGHEKDIKSASFKEYRPPAKPVERVNPDYARQALRAKPDA